MGQHPGLARTGAGHDQQRRPGVHHGLALLRVHPVQQLHRIHDGARGAVAVERVPAGRRRVETAREQVGGQLLLVGGVVEGRAVEGGVVVRRVTRGVQAGQGDVVKEAAHRLRV